VAKENKDFATYRSKRQKTQYILLDRRRARGLCYGSMLSMTLPDYVATLIHIK